METDYRTLVFYKKMVDDLKSKKKGKKKIEYVNKLMEKEPQEIRRLIDEYRSCSNDSELHRELDEHAGLAQSILYMKIKEKSLGNWKEAYKSVGEEFDLPYGGAYIIAAEPEELKRAKFSGKYSGYKAEFWSHESAKEAEFSGEYSGSKAEFKGYRSGAYATFKGKKSGYGAKLSGDYACTGSKFIGHSSGEDLKIEGRFAGDNSAKYTQSEFKIYSKIKKDKKIV